MLRRRPHGHILSRKTSNRLLMVALACSVAPGSPLSGADKWTAKAVVPPPAPSHRVASPASHSNPGSTWHPRPLALPATSDTVTPWHPPERIVSAPVPTTIVIQPPVPPPVAPEPPTPAEIRQEKWQQKRDDAKRSAHEAASNHFDRPLPPSDEINLGSRRSQLAAAAVEQLRIAHWARQRGATESAKQAATQTLRTIVALRDTEVGDNTFTNELNTAFTAIRESADFSGRYGPVDTAAIERLIEVHQTSVLKGVDTSQLTSARAVEAYLNFAQRRLVNTTAGGPLSAEATMILADLESVAANTRRTIDSSPDHSPLHSAELALMYRRASVEIEPHNAEASAELGRTLLKRSIPGPAKDLLLQSVRVAPTRQRMESLLEAAAKSGDFVLVDQCEKQLASVHLPSELPVTVMSPQEFARTGQTMPPAVSSGSIASTTGNFNNAVPSVAPGAQYRVGSRPANGSPYGNGSRVSPFGAGQIVDPTLPESWLSKPSASSPSPQPGHRLFW